MWWLEKPLSIGVVIMREVWLYFVIQENIFTYLKEGIRNSKKGRSQKLIFKGKYEGKLRNFQK